MELLQRGVACGFVFCLRFTTKARRRIGTGGKRLVTGNRLQNVGRMKTAVQRREFIVKCYPSSFRPDAVGRLKVLMYNSFFIKYKKLIFSEAKSVLEFCEYKGIMEPV